MTLPIFLELVEMKAKTASVLPFLIGLCFSAYYYNSVHPVYVGLFFVAMFLFNMFVDIWNNYNDYRNAVDLDYKNDTNIIGRENLSLRQIEVIMASLVITSSMIGLVLVSQVGLPLLWM